MKKVVLPNKIGIQHPKWFFKALGYIHQGQGVHFQKKQYKVEITPAGHALLALLSWEAEVKRVTVKGLPAVLPVGDYKDFSYLWFERALQPIFFQGFKELHQHQLDEDLLYDLEMLFNELTQNALDHAGSERFLVLLEKNAIGVFDLGVSVPAKLQQSYTFGTDVEAIELSLKKGVTTRRLRSGGMGLYYALDQLKARRGFLYVASREGQIRRYLKHKKIERKKLSPAMSGTLIYCWLGDSPGVKK